MTIRSLEAESAEEKIRQVELFRRNLFELRVRQDLQNLKELDLVEGEKSRSESRGRCRHYRASGSTRSRERNKRVEYSK